MNTCIYIYIYRIPRWLSEFRIHLGSIPGWKISPGGGHGNPLQYSCLEHPMDRGAWWAIQSMGSQRVGHD